MATDDEWDELLLAWQAWSVQPSDRTACVRLSAACAAVADDLDVPAYRVSTLLADGLRAGFTHAEVVDALANSEPLKRPVAATYCVKCGPTAEQLAAIKAGDVDTLYPTYDGQVVSPDAAEALPPCSHDNDAVRLGAEAYLRACKEAS